MIDDEKKVKFECGREEENENFVTEDCLIRKVHYGLGSCGGDCGADIAGARIGTEWRRKWKFKNKHKLIVSLVELSQQ
jgi:hypothetical protein